MKRATIYITAFLLTFAIGVIIALKLHYLNESNEVNTNLSSATANIPQKSNTYSLDMMKVIHVPNEPVKIVSIRLADERLALSDVSIEVENISSQQIAYIGYILSPFHECPGVDNHGSPRISYSSHLKPRERATLTISRETFDGVPITQKTWNCPSSAKSELYLYEIVFSNGRRWNCFGNYPQQ
jgi:hypothetical protein